MLIDVFIGIGAGYIIYLLEENTFIVIATVIFAILPDIDFLLYHARHKIDRMSHRHRRILHLPIVYIISGSVALLFISESTLLAVFFIVMSFYHFIHDSFSVGDGVQWLMPFSDVHYFFGKKTDTAKEFIWNLYKDSPENIDEHAKNNGHDGWAKIGFVK
jgi:membrane-bound metal-dependent hydrolase YbcI (DUF457 family)